MTKEYDEEYEEEIGKWNSAPVMSCNSSTDVSIRLEAVLNGRVMQPPGDSGDSPTEGPEMLDLVEGLVGEGEHSLLPDFEINERIRNFRAKNYGGRTPGTLIWSADGEVRICENR